MKTLACTLVLACLIAACEDRSSPAAGQAQPTTITRPPVEVSQTPEQRANATATADALNAEASVLQLAIPVEVSAAGVRALAEGEVIRAPRPGPGSGPQLLVTLEGVTSEGKIRSQYEFPDPRIFEVEGEGQKIAPSARTYVYVPLSDTVSQIDVKPKLEGGGEPIKGTAFTDLAVSTIQLSKVATVACSGEHSSTAMCRQVLGPR